MISIEFDDHNLARVKSKPLGRSVGSDLSPQKKASSAGGRKPLQGENATTCSVLSTYKISCHLIGSCHFYIGLVDCSESVCGVKCRTKCLLVN